MTGALGYVAKSDAARELLPALQAILHGNQFLSSRVGRSGVGHLADNEIGAPSLRTNTGSQHEVLFYSDDQTLLDHLTRFVGSALKGGNAAIVAATESHRDALLPRLQANGLDIGAAIEQGRYVALDAAAALATFVRDRMPDPVQFVKIFDQLILAAAKAALLKEPRVAIFGECVDLLWAQGDKEAAVQMEKLGNQLMKAYVVDILVRLFCG